LVRQWLKVVCRSTHVEQDRRVARVAVLPPIFKHGKRLRRWYMMK